VAVLDAPAGKADLNVRIGAVVVVAVGYEQQVGRRAEPQAVEAHRDGRGEGNALEEDLPGVEFTVPVGILENHDAAVARTGEAGLAVLVVAVFRDPHPAAVIPAERHRLRDHRLGGREFHLKSVGHRHPRHRFLGAECRGTAAFLTGEHPEREV